MSYAEDEVVDPPFIVTAEVMNEVFTERMRQKREEGWTDEHDDAHVEGELIRAAVAYSLASGPNVLDGELSSIILEEGVWPPEWDPAWFKPNGARRNLIKAAALLVAEIERLDRLEKSKA